MGRNGLTEITRLSITPTAKRNSYRVAILVGTLPRVAGHARNPGLCNRNSYRVAKGSPSPRGESPYLLCFRVFGGAPSPWGRLGWGSYVGLYAPLTTPTALLHLIIYIPFIKRVVHCSLHGVIIGLESDTKSFVPFQGFALLRLRVVADIPESGLSDIRHHPPPRLPAGRLKRSKIKKPPLAVKKPGLRRYKK